MTFRPTPSDMFWTVSIFYHNSMVIICSRSWTIIGPVDSKLLTARSFTHIHLTVISWLNFGKFCEVSCNYVCFKTVLMNITENTKYIVFFIYKIQIMYCLTVTVWYILTKKHVHICAKKMYEDEHKSFIFFIYIKIYISNTYGKSIFNKH